MLKPESALNKDKRTADGMPRLEHRHLAVIAYVISWMMPMSERRSTALHFAKHLAERNVKFDRERFLRACGYGYK